MKFENKIKGLYFFTFASGEYSDYGVNEIAVCDHLVTEDEWYEHTAEYNKSLNIKREELIEQYPECCTYYASSLAYGSEAYYILEAWKKENDIDATFQKKHGMIVVDYTECHRDD